MPVKPWLSIDEQVQLLQNRGLVVDDLSACRATLKRVGYYHLSGYARFFQVDPTNGDNSFLDAKFKDIAELQVLDSRLRNLCLGALAEVEQVLRTGFAYRFAEQSPIAGALWDSNSFTATGPKAIRVDALVLEDLDKAKQPFIVRHRVATEYPKLPVWVAVEALSFGTLSKAIQYCANSNIRNTLANDLNVAQQGFSSQVRAFVTLRNACAHNNRLWNDVARSQASVPNNILNRAKKRVGKFSPQSNYQVLVALNQFLDSSNLGEAFMKQVDALLEGNPRFRAGIHHPKPN